MIWKVIPPTKEVSSPEEKEAVLSLEGPDSSNDVCIYCHVDGDKILIGWFRNSGTFTMMAQNGKERKQLESVGFRLDGITIRIN